MRVFLATLLVLGSCSAPATLYTDEVFRGAAPEVIRSWRSLTWHDARVEDLPRGTGLKELQTALDHSEVPVALVGAALSQQERQELITANPKHRFLFFGPDSPGESSFAVSRSAAWALVALKTASSDPAAVQYPNDATPTEKALFETSWKRGGGGPLTEMGQQDSGSGPSQVFQWASNDLGAPWQTLPPSVLVHGNPGLVRQQGTSGLTWRVKEDGLGEFLWAAAFSTQKEVHFLPLETVLERR